MKIPQVNIDVWKSLYQASVRFQSLRPWELLEDSEIFGVKDPVSGQIGYCCVLGALGEVFALCMHRGSEGLELYHKMQEGEIDARNNDLFAMQNVLMAEFCDRKDLEKEDIAVIKTLKFKPQKYPDIPPYPCFRDYTPGFASWFISENEAKWLTFALRCATDLVETIEENDDLLKPEKPEHYLVYLPRDTNDQELSWTRKWLLPEPYSEPVLPEVPIDELRLRKVQNSSLQQDTPWEADAFFLQGGVILDKDRPYYSRFLMVAHKQSGFILNVEALSPEQHPHLALRDIFLGAVERHAILPNELHVRDELAWATFKPLTEKLGVKLKLKRHLSAIFEAKESLDREMRNGFRGTFANKR